MPKRMTKKQQRVRKLKDRIQRFGIASVIFNVGIVIGLFYTMFTTGNMMMMLPFIVVSALVNIVTLTKLQDMMREVEVVVGKRDSDGTSLMNDLRVEMNINRKMVMDKSFWKMMFEDVIDAIRELKERR